jgi:hypothetical protein
MLGQAEHEQHHFFTSGNFAERKRNSADPRICETLNLARVPAQACPLKKKTQFGGPINVFNTLQ